MEVTCAACGASDPHRRKPARSAGRRWRHRVRVWRTSGIGPKFCGDAGPDWSPQSPRGPVPRRNSTRVASSAGTGRRGDAGRRAPGVLGPVLRPGRVHPAVGGAGPGGGPRAAVGVLRDREHGDRPVRRGGREVHRRRRDGGLGHAGRDRGRRRARRAGGARPGGRRRRARRASAASTPWRPGPGVVTGEVAVTIGATNEGMVAGDAVNTAARVQAAAAPGQVLVDTATRRLAAGAIGFDDAGEHDLKGKAEPEQLWRATRVLSGVGGSQRVDGLEAPLTGGTPRCARSASCSTPRPSGGHRGWSWSPARPGSASRGSAGSSASTSTGWPAWCAGTTAAACRTARACRSGRWPRWCGSGSGSPRTTSRRRRGQAGAGLEEWVPDADERALRRRPAGPAARRPVRRRHRRRAVPRGAVRRLADVRRADGRRGAGRAHGRGRAARRPRAAGLPRPPGRLVPRPAGLRAGLRPARARRVRPGFGTGRNRIALTLDPLDDASMGRWSTRSCPGMPVAARRRDRRPGAGHPAVRRRDGALAGRPRRRAADRRGLPAGRRRRRADVPDSLHALLAARLDALAPDARRLVADAAVLGHDVPRRGAGRGVRPSAEARARRAGRAAAPRGAHGLGRPAVARARQLPVRPGPAPPGRLRHAVPAGPQGPTPGGRGAPAGDLPDDGEEVVDVVARHYLDALAAVPDDTDADEIRQEAVSALARAASAPSEPAHPGRASPSYADAATLTDEARAGPPGGTASATRHRRRRRTVGGGRGAVGGRRGSGPAGRRLRRGAGPCRPGGRRTRRGRTVPGRRPRRSPRRESAEPRGPEGRGAGSADRGGAGAAPGAGPRHRPGPVLSGRATRRRPGHGDADSLTSEALQLGQALDVDGGLLARLFAMRAACSWPSRTGWRRPVAHYEYAARIAERSGDSEHAANALVEFV